jgi:hypothetical protein
MKFFHHLVVSCTLACACVSCGYRLGNGAIAERYSTISVPYVEGDFEGDFTAILTQKIVTQGKLAYRPYGADLVLKASLLSPRDTTIEFRYAPPDKQDDRKKNIVVSNAARMALAAQIALIDQATGETILGPITLCRSIDYDYEPDLGKVNFHHFSLGQLEMQNLAQEAALPSLYVLLAETIADFVNNSW